MTERMYRLTQMHQRIDERLRLEIRKLRPDWGNLSRLMALKMRAKTALHRLSLRRVAA